MTNLWAQACFFPNGISGLVMAVIMFSFGGLELVGITAAETNNPEATNQVIYRILIFYYCNCRILFGLAKQGNGPKVLLKTNKSGVPLVALSVSAIATLLRVLINYLMPGQGFRSAEWRCWSPYW